MNNGFVCEFSNVDFVRMLNSFKVLVDYSLFLIEKKQSKETFLFFNYIFEKYFPEEETNLADIDYKKLFVGKYSEEITVIYKKLLELWMELQNKWSLIESNVLGLKYIEKKVDELIGKQYETNI